ncbi:MAG: hypothetical protein ACREYD_06300 [Casimicrobiaceae bacterium]
MSAGAARVAKVAAKALAATAAATVVLAILVNLRDPEISLQARAMSRFDLPAVPEAGNAYVALLGLSAAPDADPLAEGARLVAERDDATGRDPFARERAPRQEREGDDIEDGRIAFNGDRDLACDIFDEPCLPFAKARAAAISALLTNNKLLIERYLQARQMPVFAATVIANTRRANLERSNLVLVHALLLTQAALDAQQGSAGDACRFLRDDGAFWRRAMSGGATLGDKLSAFNAFSEDLRLGSEIIASEGFDAGACAPAINALLAPLTAEESSLANAFRTAFVPTLRMLASWPDPSISVEPESWPDRYLKETPIYELFYRRNASINRSARIHAGLAALATVPTRAFGAARDSFLADVSDVTAIGPGWLYNPLGKSLLGRHIALDVDYVAHAHGVAAYVALVRAQLALRLAGASPAQVPRFLEHAAVATMNPFDGRPFHWDAARRTLSFDPPDRRWRRWGASVPVASAGPAATATVPGFATMPVR